MSSLFASIGKRAKSNSFLTIFKILKYKDSFMANKSRYPKHARELTAVCKRQCFASCQGAQDDSFLLNKMLDFILFPSSI